MRRCRVFAIPWCVVACAHAPPSTTPSNAAPPEAVIAPVPPGCRSIGHEPIRIAGERAISEVVVCEGLGHVPTYEDDVPVRTTKLVLHRAARQPVETEIASEIYGGMSDPQTAFGGVLAPALGDGAVLVEFHGTGDDPNPPYGRSMSLVVYAFANETWTSIHGVVGTSVVTTFSDHHDAATIVVCERNHDEDDAIAEPCGQGEMLTGRFRIGWSGSRFEAKPLEPPHLF